MTLEERLLDNGYEGSAYFTDPGYDDAVIGVSSDGCVIYDFDLMVEALVKDEEMTPTEAVEWIDYNVIRSLPYMGDQAPIIMYKLEE